jgi:hypothetical protein
VLCVCTRACACARTCMHVYTCFGAHIYLKNVGVLYVCMCVCVYISIERERERILADSVHGSEMWCLILR